MERIAKCDLAEALQDMEIAVDVPNYSRLVGTVISGSEVADRVFLWLRLDREPEPEPARADPELAAMAAIVTAMDELDDHAILLGEDVHERVIRWAMARWNVRD